MSMIERLRQKIRTLNLTFMEHMELDELIRALEQDYMRLVQRLNSLEQEVNRLRQEARKTKKDAGRSD